MRVTKTFILASLMALCTYGVSAESEMEVSTWEGDCEHTMTTNHFEIAPGEEVEIDLNMLGCSESYTGGLLYFGYLTTNNSSKPLNTRSKIRLRFVDEGTNQSWTSDGGSIYLEMGHPARCKLYAENIDRRKTKKIRLRMSAGL